MTDFGSRKPAALLNTHENRNGQKMKPRNKAMLKAYEAIYEDGRLEWLDEQPKAGRHRVLVTVLDQKKQRAPEEVRRVLEATRGAGVKQWTRSTVKSNPCGPSGIARGMILTGNRRHESRF